MCAHVHVSVCMSSYTEEKENRKGEKKQLFKGHVYFLVQSQNYVKKKCIGAG